MNRPTALKVILGIALVGAVGFALTYREDFNVGALQGWIDSLGPWGPVAFIIAYGAATVLFLPGTVFTLAGGAMFGPLWGTMFNLTGATFGAVLAFLTARYVAADWVAAKVGGRLARIIEGVEQEGWRFVAFTRLVPLFPFNVLNYAFGLTKIPLAVYAVTSAICMIPGGFAYTYLGYAGREAVAGGEGTIQKGLLALGLVALVAFLPRFVKRLRNRRDGRISVDTLMSRLRMDDGIRVLDVRDAADFAGELGHVADALNIPLPELEARLDELEGFRDRPLAVLCRTDKRTVKAVAYLRDQGFSNIIPVDGGMVEWTKRGLPVERPSSPRRCRLPSSDRSPASIPGGCRRWPCWHSPTPSWAG